MFLAAGWQVALVILVGGAILFAAAVLPQGWILLSLCAFGVSLAAVRMVVRRTQGREIMVVLAILLLAWLAWRVTVATVERRCDFILRQHKEWPAESVLKPYPGATWGESLLLETCFKLSTLHLPYDPMEYGPGG